MSWSLYDSPVHTMPSYDHIGVSPRQSPSAAIVMAGMVIRGKRMQHAGAILPVAHAMANPRPTTIDEYIRAAPGASQPHLRALHAILKRAAPKAEETIKWGNPFFVEPRFVYAFSAHKAHLSFASPAAVLEHFRKVLEAHDTTQHMLRVRYDERLPEELIRRMAEYSVTVVGEREGEGFW